MRRGLDAQALLRRVADVTSRTILTAMGLDPTRRRQRRRTDILFVGAGVLVALVLVLWALFG